MEILRFIVNSGADVIVKAPNILGGTPVFRGTRVLLQSAVRFARIGETLEQLLEGLASVSREMAITAVEHAKRVGDCRDARKLLMDECLAVLPPTHEPLDTA